MNLLKKFFVFSSCIALLTACASHDTKIEELKAYKNDFNDHKINVFLKSFSDHRQGKALMLPTSSDIVYAYKPQTLTSGQMLPLLGYYLYHAVDFQDDNSKNSVGIDVSIRNVETLIKHDHFPVTRLGKYFVEIRARVIVRDMINNEIINTFPIIITDSKIRTSSTGRAPTTQEDTYSMLQLMDNVSIELADKVLKVTSDLVDEYYSYDNIDKFFKMKEDGKSLADKTDVEEVTESIINKTNDMNVPEISESDLGATPEMIEYIQSEEQKLLDRKEAQKKLFEKKLEDQKYLDFLDGQQ
jgi:hypothetical protein